MSISSINFGSSVLGQSVQNISNQLSDLSTELSTGVKSTNYAGLGVGEGFAIAARAQLSNIAAFGTTATNINTIIAAANNSLQSLSSFAKQVQGAAAAVPQNLSNTGQTIGQQNALADLSAIGGILNTQVGNRFIFSGTAINTPPVADANTILNGTTTQAGLKQVIAERLQADQGTNGLGRLVITGPNNAGPPTTTATQIQVAEDVAGSPFGLKLSSVSSSLTNATVTGPSGSPAAVSVDLTAGNPNPGDQISFTFNLPDGTTDSVKLTATNTTPPPTGSFAIGTGPTATAITTANLNAALNTAIGTIANTSLVAASAVEAGDNFFNTESIAVGNVATNQVTPTAQPITGATALSGAVGTDSLPNGFAPNDTITVDGTTIKFVASGATGNELNVTDNVQTLLKKIDSITGTSTPSTVSGGVITLHTDNAASFSLTSSNTPALTALGFPGGTVSAITPPLRVSGTPLGSATSLTSGTANTVAWYTGNTGPGTARSTATALIDSSQSVQFGAQANEQAIRQAVQQIAVYAAVITSPTTPNANAQISDLSQRIVTNLTPAPGQQTISDIQTEFANAQTTIKDAQARQTQTQAALQNLISNTEGIDKNQVASEILQLQTNLQASFQTTSMLSQLSLVKFLPVA